MTLDLLRASDGNGEAVRGIVTSIRTVGSTVLEVDAMTNWPSPFIATVGSLLSDGTLDPSTVTVFKGHINVSQAIIDEFAPGYTDNGNTVGQVVVVKPATLWADTLVDTLGETLNNDGSLQRAAIDSAASSQAVGLLTNVKNYTYTSPDIFINGVDQNNASNAINWTKPVGLKYVIVTAVGGGGGGGGSSTTNNRQGAGGGGGGYAKKKIMAADLAATETVTVGAPGAAGTSTGDGGAGGSSSFGAHIVCTGGGGGREGNAGITPGAGGTATGGDLNIPGQNGYGGGTTGSTVTRTGQGGNSMYGFGGQKDGTSNEEGQPGKGYGAGGSGGNNIAASRVGGVGAGGLVTVEEYF